MKQTRDMEKHDLPHKKFKAVPSAEKVMATVFWGIIDWIYVLRNMNTLQITRVQIQQKMLMSLSYMV